MKLINSLFRSGAKEILDGTSNILDKIATNDNERSKAKAELTEIVLASLNKLQEAQKDVILAEMSGNWLQRSWRPIIMLAFGFIVVYAYFIEPAFLNVDKPIASTLKTEFWELLKLGLGGFIIGRSAEKITRNVTANIDIPFLKKKDRKDKVVG